MAPRTLKRMTAAGVAETAAAPSKKDAPATSGARVVHVQATSAQVQTFDAISDFLRKRLLADHEAFPTYDDEAIKRKLSTLKARVYLMGLKTRNPAALADIGKTVKVSGSGPAGAYTAEDVTSMWKALMASVPVDTLKEAQPKPEKTLEVVEPMLAKDNKGTPYTIDDFVATVMSDDKDTETMAKYIKNFAAKGEKYLTTLLREEKVTTNSGKMEVVSLFATNYAMYVVREKGMTKAEYSKPNVLTGVQLDAILGRIVSRMLAQKAVVSEE